MSDDRFRCSFDGVAEAYERSRPGYAPDAVAWIAERLPFDRVLDLGAGTGKLTRQLVPLAREVVAVEPGDQMRMVLGRVVPGVEALFGTAEAIPLADASVDAVTVAQAFHWFDLDAALAEMHRVLRPGGGFALLWNEWDDADPLVASVDAVVARLRPARDADDRTRERLHSSPLFTALEERRFHHVVTLAGDALVELVSSVSAVAAAAPADRAAALEEVRRLAGTATVEFPQHTRVLVADRA